MAPNGDGSRTATPVDFNGRGAWVWDTTGFSQTPDQVVAQLARNRFQYVLVKAHDGVRRFKPRTQKLAAWRSAAAAHGLAFGIWGYLEAVDAAGEARLASQLVGEAGAVFYVANAEAEYENATGKVSKAFVTAFRKAQPRLPAALSSFGRVDIHSKIDWATWRDGGFEFQPQAYFGENDKLTPALCIKAAKRFWSPGAIRPTLGAFAEQGKRPTPQVLADSLKGVETRGFNVWRVGTATDKDYAALSQVGEGPISDAPRRPLDLVSPHVIGPDVRALQVAINRRRAARKLSKIDEDGEYGPDAHAAAFETAWVLGIGQHRVPAGALSVYAQRLIRDPSKRNATQLERARKRKRQLEQEQKGAGAALAFARRYVDRCEEKPIGSDRSPQIDKWGKPYGSPQAPGAQGWNWCGVFVGACLRAAGLEVPRGIIWTPTGLAWGAAGTNGFEKGIVATRDARPGDLVYFDFKPQDNEAASHVGIVEKNLGNGRLQTIEGNTAPETGPKKGSDYGVFRRVRSQYIVGCTRPRYPS